MGIEQKKFCEIRSTMNKVIRLMLTYPNSTMRVRRMPMRLSSGHVTLMPGKFYPSPPLISTQSNLGRRADSRWALPQISSFPCAQLQTSPLDRSTPLMAQTKRPDAGHIPYIFSIKIFKIYSFYAPIFKNSHYGL